MFWVGLNSMLIKWDLFLNSLKLQEYERLLKWIVGPEVFSAKKKKNQPSFNRTAVAIFANCLFFIKLRFLPIQEKSKLKASIKKNERVVNFVLNHKVSAMLISEISEVRYQVVQGL